MENKELTFKITGTELDRVNEFKKKHRESCTSKQNLTAGEYWSYTFIPGGIGTIKTIKCNLCGEEENVTDYDCWQVNYSKKMKLFNKKFGSFIFLLYICNVIKQIIL